MFKFINGLAKAGRKFFFGLLLKILVFKILIVLYFSREVNSFSFWMCCWIASYISFVGFAQCIVLSFCSFCKIVDSLHPPPVSCVNDFQRLGNGVPSTYLLCFHCFKVFHNP